MYGIGLTFNSVKFILCENGSGGSRMKGVETKSMPNPEVQLFLSGKGSWRNVSG